MDSSKLYFAGFNGFGQLEKNGKIVNRFTEFKVDELKEYSNICIQSTWNVLIYTFGNILFIRGFVDGKKNAVKRIPFEDCIKASSHNENVCLVLLNSGVLYKMNLTTFKIDELNSVLIPKSTSKFDPRKNNLIFGHSSAQRENIENEMRDEFFTHCASGRSFSVAITNKNSIYNIPLKILTFPPHVRIKKIACGNEHCLILTANGDLYAFGSSSRGQLGLGALDPEEAPVLIEALSGIKIIDIAAGGWHSAAVSAFNDLYMWGWNVNGQLGIAVYKTFEFIQKNGKKQIENQKCATVFASPIVIDLPKTVSIHEDNFENHHSPISVYAGARHTIVKTEDGILLGAGWNRYGQLANANLEKDFDHFVVLDTDIVRCAATTSVICGEWSTILLEKRERNDCTYKIHCDLDEKNE